MPWQPQPMSQDRQTTATRVEKAALGGVPRTTSYLTFVWRFAIISSKDDTHHPATFDGRTGRFVGVPEWQGRNRRDRRGRATTGVARAGRVAADVGDVIAHRTHYSDGASLTWFSIGSHPTHKTTTSASSGRASLVAPHELETTLFPG